MMHRETCCLYNNTMYPVDTLIDTVVTSDNCTQVWKITTLTVTKSEPKRSIFIFPQISLICADSGAGVGTVIAPHIGYSCHDAMMEEMELLVEACNTPATTTITTTTTTPAYPTYPTIDYTTGTTDYFYPTTIDTPIINVINNATGSSLFLSFVPDYFIFCFRWNH